MDPIEGIHIVWLFDLRNGTTKRSMGTIDKLLRHRGLSEYLSLALIGTFHASAIFVIVGLLFGYIYVSLTLSVFILAYTCYRLLDQWKAEKLLLSTIVDHTLRCKKQGLAAELAVEKSLNYFQNLEDIFDIVEATGTKYSQSNNTEHVLRNLEYRANHLPIGPQRKQKYSRDNPYNPDAIPADQLDPAFVQFIEGYQAYAWQDDDSVLGALSSGIKVHLDAYLTKMGPMTSTKQGPYRLIFDFLSPPGSGSEFQLNACAGRIEDTLCIAMDSMLIPRFLELAGSFLSVSKIFPDIGDSNKEITIQRPKLNYPGFQNIVGSKINWFPQCEIRRRFALDLTLIMLLFLLHHELAHTTEGHVDFIQEYAHLEKLWERNYREPLPIFNEAEHHADSEGAYNVFYLLAQNENYICNFLNPSIFDSLSKQQRLEATLVGLLLLFVFLDTTEMIFVDGREERDHSSIPARLHYLRIKLASFFEDSLEFEMEEIWDRAESMLMIYADQLERPDIHPTKGWSPLNTSDEITELLVNRMPRFERSLDEFRFSTSEPQSGEN